MTTARQARRAAFSLAQTRKPWVSRITKTDSSLPKARAQLPVLERSALRARIPAPALIFAVQWPRFAQLSILAKIKGFLSMLHSH
jgi:hypothetical protein